MTEERLGGDLLISETPLAIFDLETTGRSAHADIVEVSVVRIEPGQPPRLAFDSLIKPKGRLKLTEIHHITQDDVRDAPTWEEVAPAVADALSGAIWIAYNVYFDLGFTRRAFAPLLGYEVSPVYLCAANLRSLLKLGKRAKLSVSCEAFGINFREGQHIAIYDTWMTARLMRVWLDRMDHLGLKRYADLEPLGSHKYLESLQQTLWQAPSELRDGVEEAYQRQKSRYARDEGSPLADPRALPPPSSEPPFIYGATSAQPKESAPRAPHILKKRRDLFQQPSSQVNTSLPKSTILSSTAGDPSLQPSDPSPQPRDQSPQPSDQVKLRPYQDEAINAILSARRSGVKRMVVCLPTGAGKTVIFSHLASIAHQRVLVLAHREELLTQARDKLQRALGGRAQVDIEQAQRRASAEAKVVVASLRSLRSERLSRLVNDERFGLIIYDECHHAVAEDNQRVLRELGVFEDDFQGTLVGFTATTRRADGVGLDEVFEELVYRRSLQEMIKDGFLVPLRGYRISTQTSLEGVAGSGDFPLDALAEKVDIQERNGLVARVIQELARDRRTICFCVTVRHAENLADTLRSCGVPASTIHGEMASAERAAVLRAFREGTTQVLTNVGVLTEGFDDPEVSCVAMARPTRSESLYVQCVGRGMRLFEGKRDCLVIDFVDLSALNLVTLPTLYGVPVEVDFEGREASEAAAAYHAIFEETPGFEWEAASLTLTELKQRAQAFDPLRLKVSAEVRAISQSGWVSLGQRGLALHFSRDGLGFAELVILLTSEPGKRRYQILLDGAEVGRASLIEQAVEAADYEVGRMGHIAVNTASMYAEWRQSPAPPELIQTLKGHRLPRPPETLEDVFRVLTFYQRLS